MNGADKKILVLDIWRGTNGGASKSALYGELSKLYRLEFPSFRQPLLFRAWKYFASFHVNMASWKGRKAALDERAQKYPGTFRMVTKVWDRELRRASKDYDAILQIGSLFGPVSAPPGTPYFSYHDSAVANLDAMWKGWMPPDFDKYRQEWYALERKLFSSMAAVMTYSNFVRDTLIGEYGIDPARVHVVGSSLKMPEEHEIDWDARGPQVLFVTTDFERKGGKEALEIFEIVAARVPGARLVIAGGVPRELYALKRPWLEIKGSVTRGEIEKIYKGSSVLLHPARFDAFPSVILEAANFEMPCVGSRVCGIPEIIVENETGFLASPGDNSAFAEKLVTLLTNRDLLKKMGKNAKRSVRQRYHPAIVADNMRQVFEGVMKGEHNAA